MILGIDPGLRHLGYAYIDEEGRVGEHGTLVCPGAGKQPTETYLDFTLPEIQKLLGEEVDVVSVEGLTWQGSPRRILMPLGQVVGAIVGLCWAAGKHVYLLPPQMKKGVSPRRKPRDWTEHEYDAALLGRKVWERLRAERAGKPSALKKTELVGRHAITAEKPVLTRPSRPAKHRRRHEA